MTPPPAKPGRRLRLALAIAAAVVVVLALVLYASRKIIAREALTSWLQARGIASETEVKAFGLSGFTGRLRIGDPAHPDFTAEQAEVAYGLRGFALEVRSVKLTRPVIRARLHGGKLEMGALDPLIEEFRKRPPRPDSRKPRIEIDDGVLLLATDYGPVRATADALVSDGKLMSLKAVADPGVLKGDGFEASLGRAGLTLITRADRVDAAFDAPVVSARLGALFARSGRLQLTANAPYPDLQKRRGDGRVTAHATLTGKVLSVGDQAVTGAELSAGFTGQATGWIPDLAVTGEGTADLRASGAEVGPARSGDVRVAAAATAVRWTRKGGDALSARLRLTGLANNVAATEDLTLRSLQAAFHGPLTLGREGTSLSLEGSAGGRGGWRGLGRPTKDDSAEIAALKRGAASFGFAAPGIALSLDRGPLRMALTQAVVVRPDDGGRATFGPSGDGYRLTLAGGALPNVEADVHRFALIPGGAMAGGRVRAALSIGPIQQGRFDASGTVRIGEGLAFTADRCASVTAARLELGENDVTGFSGRLCPAGRPMLALGKGRWTLSGRAEGVAAEVPFLQAKVAGGSGRVDLGQTGGRLHATAVITDAQVSDTAPKTRFNSVRASGRAVLARELWNADLAFRTPAGVQVAQARLRHDGASGVGGVALDTGALAFTPAGLQPGQLSPLAEAVGSPAEGEAQFAGRFDWTKAGATSSGTLRIVRLDFKSPVGQVTGLSGEVVFTSLAPLVAAPGQVLRAREVAAFAPLTDVTATFGLEAEALRIAGGQAAVGGGRVRVESLEVPLEAGKPTRGVLNFDGVQLHDLVEASPFGERVELDAKVSGRVPFETQGGAVRILGGDLKAIQPGRLSIQRTALTAVQAEGQVAVPVAPAQPAQDTDTFTDFAYQAMENLAFDTLDAAIQTRADGRLGVLFHIIGKHDPPQHQEIRLSIFDLIQKKFLNRKLPLPSGTGVNLTLDTTLNLDELLRDYSEYQRLRGSGPVQR